MAHDRAVTCGLNQTRAVLGLLVQPAKRPVTLSTPEAGLRSARTPCNWLQRRKLIVCACFRKGNRLSRFPLEPDRGHLPFAQLSPLLLNFIRGIRLPRRCRATAGDCHPQIMCMSELLASPSLAPALNFCSTLFQKPSVDAWTLDS